MPKKFCASEEMQRGGAVSEGPLLPFSLPLHARAPNPKNPPTGGALNELIFMVEEALEGGHGSGFPAGGGFRMRGFTHDGDPASPADRRALASASL